MDYGICAKESVEVETVTICEKIALMSEIKGRAMGTMSLAFDNPGKGLT